MVTLGFNGATTMKAPLEADVANAAAAGFSGIELWGAKLDTYLETHSVKDLGRMLSQASLVPLSINSIEDATFSPDRKAVRERAVRWSKLAEEVHCPAIVVVPGVAPAGATETDIVKQSVEELRELCDLVAPTGTRLVFEMIGGQGRSVFEVTRAARVVKSAERKNLGLVIDTFHAYVGGTTPKALGEVDLRLVDIIHINDAEPRPVAELRDSHRLYPGDGALPLGEMLSALKGFRGVVSVEIFRPEYWERDPKEVARISFEKTKRVLAQAGLL